MGGTAERHIPRPTPPKLVFIFNPSSSTYENSTYEVSTPGPLRIEELPNSLKCSLNEEEGYEMRQRYLVKQHIRKLNDEDRREAELGEPKIIQEYHRKQEKKSESGFRSGFSHNVARRS